MATPDPAGANTSTRASTRANANARTIDVDAVGLDTVAQVLIRRNFLLSALELYQELAEHGIQVPVLRDFFADFAESHSAQDDYAEFSQQVFRGSRHSHSRSRDSGGASGLGGPQAAGRGADELLQVKDNHISYLEYELRLVKEDLDKMTARYESVSTSLRRSASASAGVSVGGDAGALADSEAGVGASAGAGARGSAASGTLAADGINWPAGDFESPVLDVERRALVYLIQRFLVESKLKLTAITLSDEVQDQDLSDWSDVGLGSALVDTDSEPPKGGLLAVLRAGQRVLGLPIASSSSVSGAPVESEEVETEAEAKAKAEAKEEAVAELAVVQQRVADAEARARQLTDAQRSSAQEATRLRHRVQAVEAVVERQRAEIARLKKQIGDEPGAGEMLDPKSKSRPTPEPEPEAVTPTPVPMPMPVHVPQSSPGPVYAHTGAGAGADAEVGDKLCRDVVSVVSAQLPLIVPNVLLNKREELIPVILSVIPAHTDPAARDQLMHMLFNLIKAPDEGQRSLILEGCVALAQRIGFERTEEELLPQCWEQITHSRFERRLLVAESCGLLSSHVRPELRHSLILSILVQLLDDKVEAVRAAVATNLAVLIGTFDFELETGTLASGEGGSTSIDPKYAQVESLVLRLAGDAADDVAVIGRQVVVPALAEWASKQGNAMLCTGLLETLLSRIELGFVEVERAQEEVKEKEKEKKEDAEREGAATSGGGGGDRGVSGTGIGILGDLALFEDLVPRLRATVLLEAPAPAVKENLLAETAAAVAEYDSDGEGQEDEYEADMKIMLSDGALAAELVGSKEKLDELQSAFNFLLRAPLQGGSGLGSRSKSNAGSSWPSMDWVACEAVPRLAACAASLDDHAYPALSLALTHAVWRLCSAMGRVFVRMVARPLFEQDLGSDSRGRVLTVFCGGILPWFSRKEIVDFLRDAAIRMSLDESGWNDEHVRDLELAVQAIRLHRISAVLAALWDLLVHPAAQVRRVLIRLFAALSVVLDEDRIAQRVLPALITLGNDPDSDVRRACVRALGAVAAKARNPTMLEKLEAQYDAMIDDAVAAPGSVSAGTGPIHTGMLDELMSAFSSMMRDRMMEPRVRDELVLPRVIRIGDCLCQKAEAAAGSVAANHLQLLYACYQGLNGAVVTRDSIVNVIVPSLQRIVAAPWGEAAAGGVGVVDRFRTLLRDMEAAIASEDADAHAHAHGRGGGGSGSSESRVMRARSVFGGLESKIRGGFPFGKK